MPTIPEFDDWRKKFVEKKKQNPDLRYGQDFINTFYEELKPHMPYPELYYCTDNLKTTAMILKFVNGYT